MNPTTPGGASPRGRLLIGGLRGSSGKTALTLGLIGACARRGLPVTAFKKGPAYIDAAWHTLATGAPCYCLDVFMMGAETVRRQYAAKLPAAGLSIIEGNRGLFDGVDAQGSYSTAELAKLLRVPVVLVVDATKMTRTAAALVLGCQKLDPDLDLRGVVLNMVAGERHRRVAAAAITDATGLPVLGAVPRLAGLAPERHLGLTTVEETPDALARLAALAAGMEGRIDVDGILAIAAAAPELVAIEVARTNEVATEVAPTVKIGVIRDSAFPFYYQENLEALTDAGAELVWIRALDDPELPDIDALYIGGGFPETHGARLAGNRRFRESLRQAAAAGMPIYAECGGTVFLGRRLYYRGECHEMAGVLPIDFEFCETPQGHGYTEWRVDRDNPFYAAGTIIRGHEFHYTRVKDWGPAIETVTAVERGVGFPGGREGVRSGNAVGFYGHVHALGCAEWARGVVAAGAEQKISPQRHRDTEK